MNRTELSKITGINPRTLQSRERALGLYDVVYTKEIIEQLTNYVDKRVLNVPNEETIKKALEYWKTEKDNSTGVISQKFNMSVGYANKIIDEYLKTKQI